MSKTISIKLTKTGPNVGPFNILDLAGNILASSILLSSLIDGIAIVVDDDVEYIVLESLEGCTFKKTIQLENINQQDWINEKYVEDNTGCIWTHLKNTTLYNYYYGKIEPYIIEYPFSYNFQDEILQNIKDYSEVFKYLPSTVGVFDNNRKVQTNKNWFNKAILYNGQQCSGVLELVPKPENNLFEYLKYPLFNSDSKTITFTKSDSFYQYNTFWSVEVDSEIPMFTTSCESLSIDKVINQSNMDYGQRSFKKSPLRARELKVRHILDNSSTTHIVSQFIITPAQISYK